MEGILLLQLLLLLLLLLLFYVAAASFVLHICRSLSTTRGCGVSSLLFPAAFFWSFFFPPSAVSHCAVVSCCFMSVVSVFSGLLLAALLSPKCFFLDLLQYYSVAVVRSVSEMRGRSCKERVLFLPCAGSRDRELIGTYSLQRTCVVYSHCC